MASLYIIGEAGGTHEGSLARAKELIWLGKQAGADAVKMQYWSSPARMRERRHVDDPTTYTQGSVERSWLPELADWAHTLAVDFMCSCYLPEDIEHVAPYVSAFKVSSFEAFDERFVHAQNWYRRPVYVSTGMSDGHLAYVFGDCKYVRLLHCVSAYPCPPAEANIGGMKTCEGYSDHTRNVLTGAVAVGAGARVLEVHFRLDDTSPECPDYCVSLSPEELRQYVANARLAHVLMGDGVKRVMPSEEGNVKYKVTEL